MPQQKHIKEQRNEIHPAVAFGFIKEPLCLFRKKYRLDC
jgi:hypothetical protein